MLLADISTWTYQAVRAKLHPDQIIVIMDAVQRMAFDYNAQAFLVWTETLTPQFVLTFASGGYTSAIAGDLGKTVVGSSSGATGVLISYDNTAKTWNVTSSNDTAFTDSEAVTITTGTGAGTLDSEDAFTGFLGPYDAPTDPPCRKIWGVTTETDARIFGTSDDLTQFPMEDFDFQDRNFNPGSLFKAGREDNIAKQFTFVQKPALPSTSDYRWVYWRDPPTIDGISDETQLVLPATYHLSFVNACIKLAQMNISGEDVDPKALTAFFQTWWNTLARPFTPMGKATNRTLNARGNSQSLI